MLALAVRFSDAPYFAGRIHDAAAAYSRQSWLCVIEDHLSVDENLDLSVIQTVALLAIVDYTGKPHPHSSEFKLSIADFYVMN